uniref:Putative evasin n=1 Tax=Amblyomma americanum TaxID=6943 RepID=A0A0C9SDE2_AMBAM
MHSTIAYVFVSALALFAALHGSTSAGDEIVDESSAEYYDGNSTDYDYKDGCSCPFPHLNNTNGTSLNSTVDQAKKLTTTVTLMSCTVGKCKNGTCVANGTVEHCFRQPKSKNEVSRRAHTSTI